MMGWTLRAKRALAALAAFLLLAGCAPEAPQASPTRTPSATEPERTFFAMDTVMTLKLHRGGNEAVLDAAEERVAELEALWSVTDENSEIYALNRNGFAALSGDTVGLLANTLEMCERTGGALDITIYPVVRAWGFTTGEYAVPDDAVIEELLTRVD